MSLVPRALGRRRLLPLLSEFAVPLALAALLAFLAVGAGLTTMLLWNRLSWLTLRTVALVLDLLVSPIYFDAANVTIGTEEFSVRLDPVCSG